MKHFIQILVLCIGIPMGAGAQTFTQRLQKPVAGQGSVTIHQSDSIDMLVNTTVLTPKSTTTTTKTTSTSSSSSHSSASSVSSASSKSTTTPLVAETPDTTTTSTQKILRGQKVMGYRVQAFAGGNSRKDRQQAEQVRNNIKSHYPNVPVYVHFYSPRWICRVGNYRTYEEAHQMLVSLRALGFEQATIVKGKITVAY
ncbi:MAG: SPOR domain-containing protein [Prevotella sp.]|nr:SPOR domain-containing protein [Prevotella sp.]